MNFKIKGIVFFVLFFLLIFILVFIITSQNNKQWDQDQKDRLTLVGNVEFKGEVINSKVYEFAGKNYYMVCVKLDSSNVKDLYILNNLCAVKIKNNIATMSASVFNPDQSPIKYVEVNINHNGKEIFHFKDGTTDESELFLIGNGLSEKDMNLCN